MLSVDCFQANEEKREMDALQHSNKRILFNLLPAHVATHFLDNQFRSNMVTSNHMQWLNVSFRTGLFKNFLNTLNITILILLLMLLCFFSREKINC
jgi:hypothetical protein